MLVSGCFDKSRLLTKTISNMAKQSKGKAKKKVVKARARRVSRPQDVETVVATNVSAVEAEALATSSHSCTNNATHDVQDDHAQLVSVARSLIDISSLPVVSEVSAQGLEEGVEIVNMDVAMSQVSIADGQCTDTSQKATEMEVEVASQNTHHSFSIAGCGQQLADQQEADNFMNDLFGEDSQEGGVDSTHGDHAGGQHGPQAQEDLATRVQRAVLLVREKGLPVNAAAREEGITWKKLNT